MGIRGGGVLMAGWWRDVGDYMARSVVQSQHAVSAYFTSKYILPFGFAETRRALTLGAHYTVTIQVIYSSPVSWSPQ